MKRWLVVLLVVLAVVILVAPGIVGRLAEKNIEENLNWAATESAGFEIQTERFDRGWFSSEGRHRVVFRSTSLREAAEIHRLANGYEDLASLIIDTRIDHGPIPGGSMKPGLASTVSTFQIDPGNGELVSLPGTLYTNVSLSGATDSQFLLESGRFENAEGSVDWSGADIALQTDSSDGTLVIDGTFAPITIATGDESVRIGTVTVAAEQARGDYGFNEGSISIGFESFVIDSPGNAVTVGAIAFSAEVNIDDARLNVGSRLSIDEIVTPVMGETSIVLELALNRLDAESMQVITRAIEETQRSPDPDAALAALYPQIEGDLQKLVAAGGEIRVDQFEVTLPQGTLTTNLVVEIPEGAAGANFNWSSVLLAMTASADIRMPEALFEFVVAMNPQANALLAMGILQRDGEHYVMNAEYAQGLVNVNGAPMPIPMPGM